MPRSPKKDACRLYRLIAAGRQGNGEPREPIPPRPMKPRSPKKNAPAPLRRRSSGSPPAGRGTASRASQSRPAGDAAQSEKRCRPLLRRIPRSSDRRRQARERRAMRANPVPAGDAVQSKKNAPARSSGAPPAGKETASRASQSRPNGNVDGQKAGERA